MTDEKQLTDGWVIRRGVYSSGEGTNSYTYSILSPNGGINLPGNYGEFIWTALASRDEQIKELRETACLNGTTAITYEKEIKRLAREVDRRGLSDEQVAALQEVAEAFISASITGIREGGRIVRHRCDECGGVWMPDESEYHRNGCVIAKARALGALKEE